MFLLACSGPDPAPVDSTPVEVDSAPEESAPAPVGRSLRVRVLLDGKPAPDTLVQQGGVATTWRTDAAGEATVYVDYGVEGDIVVLAAHPEARVDGDEVEDETVEPFTIELVRFDPTDNVDYPFQDPGEGPQEDSSSDQCLHCHATLHEGWFASPHRTAASGGPLHDLYQGVAFAFDEATCAARGGAWGPAVTPGTGAEIDACSVGAPLPAHGAGADGAGGCADCHAPGIDGELGGRDLLEARGVAYAYGVHCDVCHKVEGVDLDAPPGVGGRLHVVRPMEPTPSELLGTHLPLTFGPDADVLNPRMGQVHRGELFHSAELCAGCHEHHQAPEAGEVDLGRWPDGRLPIHTTWSEWEAGPMNPSAPCQACHMPPDPSLANGADLYREGHDGGLVGISSGWERPPGAVNLHTFAGPRGLGADGQPSPMLQLAAALDVAVERGDDGDPLVVDATVRNVGPGHAIPTGEPMRALILVVEAACDGAPLVATGGDAIPEAGGARAGQDAAGDWTRWPEAEVGDVVRVVRRKGWWDYLGYGPFGDGTFDAEAKGLPADEVVGEATILAVVDGVATFDVPLPAGDHAWLVGRGDYAGAAGFAFARVLEDAEGRRMAPHALAVDVVSDNRLLPTQAWTSRHAFAAGCADPSVTARLLHRNYPAWLAEERGWTVTDTLMAEVTR